MRRRQLRFLTFTGGPAGSEDASLRRTVYARSCHPRITRPGTVWLSESGYSGNGNGQMRDLLLSQTGNSYDWMEYPPSTAMAVPVTKSEAAAARKTAVPASSSGVPQRFAGVRSVMVR